MKKVLNLLLILSLFNSNLITYASTLDTGTLTDIHISQHNGLSHTVYEGDTINLSLKLKNRSGETLNNIYITVLENDSFYPLGSGSNIFVASELTNDEESFVVQNIPIMYTEGSNQRLSIRITYTKQGTVLSTVDYIGIKTAQYQEPTPTPPEDTTKKVPRLSVSTGNNLTVEAGRNASLPITIKNSSNHSAQNVVIASSFDGQDIPFTFDQSNESGSISSISSNGSRAYNIDFYVNPTAEEKTYQLKLNFKFTNSHGDPFESSETLYIKVVNNNTFPKFAISDISMSPTTLTAGETITLGFILQNIGSIGAKDIKITLNGLKTDGLTILNSSNVRHHTRILGGNQSYISYTLNAPDTLSTGLYDLDIHLEYKDDGNKTYEETQKIFIPVTGSKSLETKSIPKLIIDQYVAAPNMVKAGENYNLKMSFFNTHKEKPIHNIKIYLTIDEKTETSGNVFTPVNSSNTFFIDYIDPKSAIEKSIELYTVPDAKQKTYTITANFEYEDLDGNEYKASELIGIPVIQQSRLETGELSIPPGEAYVGQSFPISLEFYNMGKIPLYNLMVKTEGNFNIEQGNYFVGNFESGKSDYYEAYITPSSPGPLEGSVLFTYDDPAGEKIELSKNFSINVIEMQIEEIPPNIEGQIPTEGSNKNTIIWISSAITVLFIVIAAIFFRIKRKNKEKGMFLDE